jgi:ABC-type transport system involved in multi-copper enzyme maturation permease subunit
MNLVPVIDRELRMRARQGVTYWTRCAVAAMATMVGVQELVLSSALNPTSIGVATFRAVSWVGFLVACISALVTADCISRERRDGTLGLLLLTELKSFDVVLGKLCAAGLAASYALVGFLPALGLVVLAGGVSGGQVVRTALALLNSVFVALAAGLWVSARAQSRSSALRGTILFVLLLCILPRIAMNVGRVFTPDAQVLACFSPYSTFYLASDAAYAGQRSLFWISICLTQLEAWVLLGWTGLRLLRNWRAVEWSPKPKPPEWEPVLKEEAQAMAASRAALLEEDPICWAVSRMRIQSALIWVGTLLLLLGGTGFSWGTLVAGTRGGPTAMGVWNSLHLLVSLGAAALLAWAAGRFFFEGQRNGELELLLSSPIGARDIVGGNWRALCKPLRGAWLLVGFLVVFELIAASGPGALSNAPGGILGVFQRAMAPVVRVLDIMALCWMGMWFGLKARKPVLIMGWTVGLVVGLPWILSYVFIIGTSLGGGTMWGGRGLSLTLVFWLVAWPLLNLVKDLFFISWAARKLRTELRTKAALGAQDWLK